MPSIFHGLLHLWMNYPPFMMHIRCIILYAVKFFMETQLFTLHFSSPLVAHREKINPQLKNYCCCIKKSGKSEDLNSLRKELALT